MALPLVQSQVWYLIRSILSGRKMSASNDRSSFIGRAIDAAFIAVASLVLGLLGTLVLSWSKPVLDWFHQAGPTGIAAALAIPPGLLVLLIYFVGRNQFLHLLHYPYRPKRFFRVIKQTISFEVKGTSAEYTKEKRLKSLRGEEHYYEDMFRWTGSSSPVPQSVNTSHTVELDDRVSIWQMYRIKFNKHLGRGDVEDTSLRWAIADPTGAVPFISTTVEEPTDLLQFCFKPQSNTVSRVFFETKFSISAKRPFETEELVANNDGIYTKELKPRLYYYYELRWVLRPTGGA